MDQQKLKDSIKRDIEFTSGNYAQMYKRLQLNDVASRFFIIYYSTISIIYALFPVFFEDEIISSNVLNFLMISLSIIVLIASLLVSFAQYAERSKKAMIGLDHLKRLKKKLIRYSEDELQRNKCEKYKSFVKEYHQIVDSIELRSDFDYFRACKELKSRGKYVETWLQIPCTSKMVMYVAYVMKLIFCLALFLFPILMLLVIF